MGYEDYLKKANDILTLEESVDNSKKRAHNVLKQGEKLI